MNKVNSVLQLNQLFSVECDLVCVIVRVTFFHWKVWQSFSLIHFLIESDDHVSELMKLHDTMSPFTSLKQSILFLTDGNA